MKKLWLVFAGVLLAVAISGHWWFPPLLAFIVAGDHPATIQTLSGLASAIIGLVGAAVAVWAVAVAKKQLALAQNPPPVPAPARAEASASRAIAVGGSVSDSVLNTGVMQAGNVIGNVDRVGDLVGRDKITINVASPQTSIPHQLPPPPGDFTGREAELRELLDRIGQGGATISGLRGMGGIGKTALALKLGEILKPQFPDGQIYIDLKGFDSKTPLTPAEAQARVIRSYQPEALVPEDADSVGNFYRSVLDGKRALLLMDNARDAAQVEPLIPPAGSILVVTSRSNFTLPGLFAKDLDTLPDDDARELLLKIAPRIGDYSGEVARLCGYLALALRAAGSLIAETPGLDPADYVKRLNDERDRLRQLKRENIDVEASIGLSYGMLKPETALVLRQLTVFPGGFDSEAEVEVCQDEGHAQLDELVRKSLVQYNPETGRYILQDLVRVFAAALIGGERAAAERSHSAHYERVLRSANALYLQGGEGVLSGLKLLDREWPNIQAGQAWAARYANADSNAANLCNNYPDAGASVLFLRQHPRQRIRWLEAALAAASRLRDRGSEGAHLGNLGLAYHSLGEYRRAIEYYEKRLLIAREIGDRVGESRTIGNLGLAYCYLGEYRRAVEYCEQRLAIARETSNRRGEGSALGNLGLAYHSLGEYRRAIEYHEQCLAIAQDNGDSLGEGNAIGNLGTAYCFLGEYRQAIEYYEQQLAITRDIGDRLGEGNALGGLGVVYKNQGEYRLAIEHYEQALAIARQIGDRHGEGNALGSLGNAYYSLGEHRRAIEHHEEYLAIAQEIGDRGGEANALWNMSLSLKETGSLPKAITNAETAQKIYERIESPHTETVRERLAEWKAVPPK